MLSFFKGISIISGGIISSFVCLTSVNAATYNASNESNTIELPDSATIIRLPDGGTLHGEMSITHANGSSLSKTIKYNSDTDKNAISMKELRSGIIPKQSGSSSSIVTMGLSPSDDLYTLRSQAMYTSEAFTGSGWRFAGYKFVAASGTGQYLLWNSVYDSGLVGTVTQAWSTKNGSPSGTEVGGLSGKYISGTTTFYTYNPAYSMHYVVANR